MFFKGFIIGFAGIAAYLWVFHHSLGAIMGHNPRFPKFIYAVSYLLRFALMGLFIYLFLKYRVGSTVGLLAGIVAGTIGYTQFNLKKIKPEEHSK
jgi:predicted branched-subunit amino acid permease